MNEQKKLIPGVRLIQVRFRATDQSIVPNETFELELEYLGTMKTWHYFDSDKLQPVAIDGWICKVIETGKIIVFDPDYGDFYFKGESPMTRKKV